MFVKTDNKNRRYLISEQLNKYSCIKHIFSTRDFGNQGLHVDDIYDNVIKNRKELASTIGIDYEDLTSGKQVHGVNIKIVNDNDKGKGALDFNTALDNIDGLITNTPNIPLFSFYADCTPILLFDYKKEVIGILHGGWKGTLGNIAGKSVKLMKEVFNSNTEDLIYVIGPRIGINSYEVSKDILNRLNEMNMRCEPFVVGRNIDLGEINKELLIREGIVSIELDNHCTCADDMFYSHRCENGNTGRMAGIIMLHKEVENE